MALGMLGRYRLIRKLAQGGMAEVFLAKSYGAHGFEKPVAIKRILSRFAEDQQFVTMLIDEAKITSLLSHPNIVPVIDFHADNKDCYLVMEYVPGRSMSGLLRTLATDERSLSIEHLLHVIRETAMGLHHAHIKTDRAGHPLRIVHRDVSPQNVLLGFEGYVKVIDFGIARARNRLAKTEAGTLKGKLRYLAPEQVDGREVDGRTDQFALGITLWEALTGRALFSGDSDVQIIDQVVAARVPDPRDFNRKIPDELARALMRALQKDKDARFASCEAFAADLRGILARLNPDYDPASLGALMRTQFAADIEEDTREEAEAEAELARAGVTDPVSGELATPRIAPAPEHTSRAAVPASMAATAEDVPITLPRGGKIIGGRKSTQERAPAAVVPAAAQARRERAQKGTRAADARRVAEQEAAAPEAPDIIPLELDKPGVDKTLTGTEEPGGMPAEGGKVVVPVPRGVPVAGPSEPTRAAFDLKQVPPRREKKAAAAPVPRAQQRSSLALLAVISGVGGALIAIILGLVVAGRLDATPVRSSPMPGRPTDATVQPSPVTPRPAPAPVATLSVEAMPNGARIMLDRDARLGPGEATRVAPGKHRVVVSADGYETQEREVELAAGDARVLTVELNRVPPKVEPKPVVQEPPPRREPPPPRQDPPPRQEPRKAPPAEPRQAAKGQLKLVTPGTWANITLDGKRLKEVTPVVLDVPAGAHTVVLTRGDGTARSYPVTVEPGAVKTLRGEFE
ncbi:MAG: serine/threonine protein kinase [Deltaproteobacteria bacterium]|nr:serine/threonine protein kinase [Deltaproteobacteria bacterium]